MLQGLQIVKHKALVHTHRRQNPSPRMYRQPGHSASMYVERRSLGAVLKHLDRPLGRSQHDLAAGPDGSCHGLADIQRPLHRLGVHRVDVELTVQAADRRVPGLGIEGRRVRHAEVGIRDLFEGGHVVGAGPALRGWALLAAFHQSVTVSPTSQHQARGRVKTYSCCVCCTCSTKPSGSP